MNYPENVEEIRKFAKKINLDVKYLLGEKYEGHLYLSSVKSLPANIVFNVGDDLHLYSVESLPANVLFNVSRKIYLPTKHKVKVIWG